MVLLPTEALAAECKQPRLRLLVDTPYLYQDADEREQLTCENEACARIRVLGMASLVSMVNRACPLRQTCRLQVLHITLAFSGKDEVARLAEFLLRRQH